jgi:hypothetical protein
VDANTDDESLFRFHCELQRYIHCQTSTLRTRTEMVFETFVCSPLNHLTRLIGRENFIIQFDVWKVSSAPRLFPGQKRDVYFFLVCSAVSNARPFWTYISLLFLHCLNYSDRGCKFSLSYLCNTIRRQLHSSFWSPDSLTGVKDSNAVSLC